MSEITYITNNIIKELYNIEKERKLKDYAKSLGPLFSFEMDDMSLNEVITLSIKEFAKFPKESYIVDENYSYGGGADYYVYIMDQVPETDTEVINRLRSIEKAKVKKEKEIEKARELLDSLEGEK